MDTNRTVRRRWEWWHRQTPTTRRSVRAALALLATGFVALVVGVSTAGTHSSLGPHEAVYQVTLDRQVTVGLGPLGALIVDSPLPWPLGVDVRVEEIPSDLETAGGNPLTGLLGDLQAYGQLFGEPEAAVADAVDGLVSDALGRTVVAWSVMLAVLAVGRLAAHGRLRDELKAALARPGVAVLAVTAALSAVAALVVPAMEPHRPVGYSPEVLDGTPLAGARITGRLADVVAAYGPVVKNAYLDNERFYDTATVNLVSAYAADPEPHAPAAKPAVTPDGVDDGAPSADDAPPDGRATADDAPPDGRATAGVAEDGMTPPPEGQAAAAEEPGDDAEAPAMEVPEPDPVTLLLVADLHCNVGMARVVGAALEQSRAEVLLDAGDTVVSGTSVESYCVNAFAGAVPDGVPVVVATGNHDSVTTAEQERKAGSTVLGGEVVEVAGLRILGETDPTITAVGAGGTRPERDETIPELETRMAEVACAATDEGGPVDILLTHNPRVGGKTLDRGCARLRLRALAPHRRAGGPGAGHALREHLDRWRSRGRGDRGTAHRGRRAHSGPRGPRDRRATRPAPHPGRHRRGRHAGRLGDDAGRARTGGGAG
ncbi:metallophosphoesterase [Georgenia yuyongxinii]